MRMLVSSTPGQGEVPASGVSNDGVKVSSVPGQEGVPASGVFLVHLPRQAGKVANDASQTF